MLISAFLKIHIYLVDEIGVELLVIDLVVGQELEDVQFLRLAVVLEEIGVVGNQAVGIGRPWSEYIEEFSQGADLENQTEVAAEHCLTGLSII